MSIFIQRMDHNHTTLTLAFWLIESGDDAGKMLKIAVP